MWPLSSKGEGVSIQSANGLIIKGSGFHRYDSCQAAIFISIVLHYYSHKIRNLSILAITDKPI